MQASRNSVLLYVCLLGAAGQTRPSIASQGLTAPKLPDPPPGGYLQLDEVIKSTLKNYPPLLAVFQNRPVADAEVLTAEGRFDYVLKAKQESDFFSFYRNQTYDTSLEQATAWNGLNWFGGYRLGVGDFAAYDGKKQTDSLGEYRMGLMLPLFRDRAVDPRRATLYKAQMGVKIADLTIDQQKLLFVQAATRRYWDWVAAGRRLEIARTVLQVAQQRDSDLRTAAQLGQIPRIDVDDNLRAILTRQNLVFAAERGLQLAANDLALFYRDDAGGLLFVDDKRLPPAFPEVQDLNEQRMRDDLELAQRRRPEIQRFAVQRDQVDVDRRLARNQLMPNVDVVMSYTRESGDRIVKRGPDEFTAGLNFTLPVQRRAAKGQEAAALARIEQFNLQERFARDVVAVEVRDAYSQVIQAVKQARTLRERVTVTRSVEDAERVRFQLGEGTLFQVNLREQDTFDALILEVGALNEYYRALANYEFAIAEALTKYANLRP